MAARLPTYVTIKDVKRRWGHGQEDIYPVAQFEKLWGDMSSLPDLNSSFLAVSRAASSSRMSRSSTAGPTTGAWIMCDRSASSVDNGRARG